MSAAYLRSARFGRGRPSRDPLPLILVVCEGRVTEREYLDGFRIAYGSPTVRVQVVSPGGDPVQLVNSAISLRDDARSRAVRAGDPWIAYDEVWCVCDVDSHERLVSARTAAAAGNVHLVTSNPCFELWLFLHFASQTAHVSVKQIHRMIARHLPNYRKHLTFGDLVSGYDDAVGRARALERIHEGLGLRGANPSSDVYRLTERIRGVGKGAKR